MKFGLDYSRIRAKSYFNNNTGGTFTFATDRPFDANDLTTYPTQYTQNIGDPRLRRPNDVIGVFAQDSWHVRPNFTLNYGLRYDHETAFKEATGVEDASLNLAPRFGFAWDPRNNQKTVVRGGIGQYYSKVFLNITGNIQLARAFTGVTIVNPGFPDPYRAVRVSPPSAPSTTVAPDEVNTPVTRQASIGVKRELFASMAVSADLRQYARPQSLQRAGRERAGSAHRPPARPGLPAHRRVPVDRQLLVQRDAARPRAAHFGRGPAFGLSYTLSKQTRDVEDFGFTPQNNYDRAAEKGPASNDRRHQFVANMVYPLPWTMQIGLFAQARSGLPFNITTGVDNNRDTTINERPDLANPDGDPLLASTYNANFTGRVGNLPRNFARGPGTSRRTCGCRRCSTFDPARPRSHRVVRRSAQRHQPCEPGHAAGQPPLGRVRAIDGSQRRLEPAPGGARLPRRLLGYCLGAALLESGAGPPALSDGILSGMIRQIAPSSSRRT